MKIAGVMLNLFVSFTLSGVLMSTTAIGQSDKEAVAEVSGQKLTVADLEQKKAGALLQARSQYYQSQRKALDQLVDDELLEIQARRAQLTVDQLLEKEVYKAIKDPTDDQLKVYYEGLETEESYDSVHDRVLEHIRQLRRDKARAAYIKALRSNASVRILLAPPAVEISAQGAYARGPENAPVTLIEYADYECPYCQRVNPDLQKLKEEYGAKLNVVYKDFPLPMHKRAEKAAEAARCAGEQGKYWEYHDVLYYSRLLDIPDLKKHAAVLKLDQVKFDHCLDSGSQAAAVRKDLEESKHLGLTGTPSFFVNGHFFSGAVDGNTLREMIEQQLPASPAAIAQATSQK